MDGYEWVDRETQELNWQESLELMAEFGLSPDWDEAVKENDLQAWLVDQEVEAAVLAGESIPF